MVMNDPESVAQFHAGGASNPAMQAVYDFSARALDALLPRGGRLLDLGVGSGRALRALMRLRPDVEVMAVDLAPNMLASARELFVADGVDQRVELVEADITALPERLAAEAWDGVSCVWTLHQLPDFETLRAALRQIAALRRNCGAAVWIFDFQRLRDPSALPTLAPVMDPGVPPVLLKDGIASEAAAFTESELTAELAAAGLDGVRSGHARPLPYLQAHWLPGKSGTPGGLRDAHRRHLRGRARRDAAMLRWGFSAKPF
jgi:tRNA (cmo5U34)-methyltransferase